MTYVVDEDEVIHLLTMYDKSELDTIATPVLRELARELMPK